MKNGDEPNENSLVITGSNEGTDGKIAYHLNSSHHFEIHYSFTLKKAVNPRQIGLVFKLPKELDQLSWQREGLWNVYPSDHIGRLSGNNDGTEGAPCSPVGPKTSPKNSWRLDRGSAGNHDFCSTKHNVSFVSLLNAKKEGIAIRSKNNVHSRCWQSEENTYLLIASYSNGGSERFLRGLAEVDDKKLKSGDTVEGHFQWEIIN